MHNFNFVEGVKWVNRIAKSITFNTGENHLLNSMYCYYYFVWTRCCTLLSICHTTPTQKQFCLHVFCQAWPPQRVDCLAPSRMSAFSVLLQFISIQRKKSSTLKQGHNSPSQILAIPIRINCCIGIFKTCTLYMHWYSKKIKLLMFLVLWFLCMGNGYVFHSETLCSSTLFAVLGTYFTCIWNIF